MFRVLFLILVLLSSAAFSLMSKSPSPNHKPLSPIPEPTRLCDTIGKVSDNELIARFEGLRIELEEDETARGCIINYGTKSQIKKRNKQIKKAFLFLKIDPSRITTLKGGDQDSLETSVCIVLQGVECPQPYK